MSSSEAASSTRLTYAPYVGMRPYEREERAWFFGRDRDARLLHDKILAARLTILYSLSGLGKSSLLRALVIPKLQESDALVVRFEEWAQQDPAGALKQDLSRVAATLGIQSADGAAPTLLEIVQRINHVDSRPVVLVLDQFEEFLTNHQELDPLRKELAALVRSSGVDAQVILSLREEFLGALEPFRHEILNLFQSTYRLEPLDDRQVADVIRLPAEHFKGTCDRELIDALTEDLKLAGQPPGKGAVDLPMLQIVCKQLWEEAQKAGNVALTIDLYKKMGGAQKVLEGWVNAAMPRDRDDQHLTARMMLLLAPSSGLKLPFSAADLAISLDLDRRQVEAELQRLSDSHTRVLRQRNYSGGLAYELQHDALIRVLTPWRDAVLRRAEEVRQVAAARKRFRNRAIAGAITTAIAALLSVVLVQWRNQARVEHQARVEKLIEQVINSSTHRTDAVLLGVAAFQLSSARGVDEQLSLRAERSLRGALANIGGVPFGSGTDMTGVAVAATMLVTTAGSTVQVWDTRDPLKPPIQLTSDRLKATTSRLLSSLSDDGRWLATADDTFVFIWNLGEPTREPQWVDVKRRVTSLAFSARGERLALGIEAVGVEVWSIQPRISRSPPLRMPPGSRVDVLALTFSSPDPRFLFAGMGTPDDRKSGGRVLVWDVSTAGVMTVPETRWQDPNAGVGYYAMAFGDGGQWLADVNLRGNLRVWDLRGPKGTPITLEGMSETRRVRTAAFVSPGPRLALASQDKETETAITVWNVRTHQQELELRGHERPVVALASGGLRRLASVAADGARLWDIEDPAAEPRIVASSSPGDVDIVFWPDKPWAVVKDDNAIAKIDLTGQGASEELVPRAPGEHPNVQAVSGRGLWLAAGRPDGRLFLWQHPFDSRSTRSDLRSFDGGARTVKFSPDERWLAAGAAGVMLVDLASRPFSEHRLSPELQVDTLAFSDNGRWLVGSAPGKVLLWDLRDGRFPRVELSGVDTSSGLVGMAFHTDNQRLAAVYSNRVILLWNLDRLGEPQRVDVSSGIETIRGLAFTPGGRRLAIGSANGAYVLEDFWEGKEAVRRIAVDTRPTQAVYLSSDGERLATGASDGTAHIWDLSDGSVTGRGDFVHQGTITSVSFSNDRSRMASVTEHQGKTQARLWTVEAEDLVRLACRAAWPRVELPGATCDDAGFTGNCDVCRGLAER